MNAAAMMHLEIMTPEGLVVDANVVKVSAEATNGLFTLLPVMLISWRRSLPG